jgi:hypothetical protein
MEVSTRREFLLSGASESDFSAEFNKHNNTWTSTSD